MVLGSWLTKEPNLSVEKSLPALLDAGGTAGSP
jgi:hypothetical protein